MFPLISQYLPNHANIRNIGEKLGLLNCFGKVAKVYILSGHRAENLMSLALADLNYFRRNIES